MQTRREVVAQGKRYYVRLGSIAVLSSCGIVGPNGSRCDQVPDRMRIAEIGTSPS